MAFSFIQQAFFLGSLALVSAAFLYTIHDFFAPIFWGIVLTIVFYPLFERFRKLTRHRAWAASLLTILAILVLVILPTFLIGRMAVNESIRIYETINTGDTVEGAKGTLSRSFAVILPHLERFDITETTLLERARTLFSAGSQWIAGSLISAGQFTVTLIIHLLVMLYLLFFMFRDGEGITNQIKKALPLGESRENRLFSRFAQTTRAVVKGTILIGVLQGFLGGVLFALVGIDAPVLWGVVMAIFSIIPGIGPAIVWLPAGILLILGGSVFEGLVVLLGGTLVVGLVDNALRPMLVGRDTGMSDALVLVSTIGGLAVFGISGFVIGPIVAAFFIAFWELFEEMYKTDLESAG